MPQEPTASDTVDVERDEKPTGSTRFVRVPFESLAPMARLAAKDELFRLLTSPR